MQPRHLSIKGLISLFAHLFLLFSSLVSCSLIVKRAVPNEPAVQHGHFGLRLDAPAHAKGAYIIDSMVEFKDDLDDDSERESGIHKTDLRLNMLAKEAFLEFQNYLQAVTTKYKENWVRADSRYRPAVLVLLAVKVPEKFSHDTKAKTYLFLASSAKGAGIVYQDMAKDIKQKFPYVSNVLKSVLDECEKESEHGHRNSAACGEINALMGFFNWAKSRGISEDDARQMLHANSKSVAWWRPPVTANPKAPKREREEQQRAFDSVPSGEYRNPCSEDDTGDAKKEGFGCEAVLQHFNIRVVQRLGKNLVGNEQLFNERKAQPGEIMKTHVVSAITMAKGTNIVPVQQAAPPANNPWGKPGQSSGGG